MVSRYIWVGVVGTVTVMAMAYQAEAAGPSNFARDRNVAVTERIPAGYEPLGLHLGAFDVLPVLGIGAELNDNIYYTDLGKTHDTITSIVPGVTIKSDWGRHALQAKLSGQFNNYLDHSSENTTFLDAGIGGRLDIHGNSYAFAAADISQNYEPRYDPSTPRAAVKPIKYDVTQANGGVLIEGNRLQFTERYDYAKYDYFNGLNQLGQVVNQDNRDYTYTALTSRGDYAISPDTSVFVAYVANNRDYRDPSVLRDSHGWDFGVGVSFDLTNLARGEMQVGYLEQKYKNPGFKNAKGGSVRGKVQYFPTELTTLTLQTSTSIEETPDFGSSGFTKNASKVSVDHELLRDLVLSAAYSMTDDKYRGEDRHDKLHEIDLLAKYLVSRNIFLRGGYIYSDLRSHGVSGIPSYQDNAFRMSLGLQY